MFDPESTGELPVLTRVGEAPRPVIDSVSTVSVPASSEPTAYTVNDSTLRNGKVGWADHNGGVSSGRDNLGDHGAGGEIRRTLATVDDVGEGNCTVGLDIHRRGGCGVAHDETTLAGCDRRDVIAEDGQRRSAGSIEMGNDRGVARGRQRDVAGIDGDGVGSGELHLKTFESGTGEGREVLGLGERKAGEDIGSVGRDIHVGVGDAVDQVDPDIALEPRRGRRRWRRRRAATSAPMSRRMDFIALSLALGWISLPYAPVLVWMRRQQRSRGALAGRARPGLLQRAGWRPIPADVDDAVELAGPEGSKRTATPDVDE